MSFEIIIKPQAEKDLYDAVDWYNSKQNDLGFELFSEISRVIDIIQKNPNHYQKRYKIFRICFTKRFSYGIHYSLENNTIFIHAILHTNQELLK